MVDDKVYGPINSIIMNIIAFVVLFKFKFFFFNNSIVTTGMGEFFFLVEKKWLEDNQYSFPI